MSKGLKMSRFPHDAKVYVGDLGNNASKQELEDAFGYYGPLRNVWVARNPPGFAFVEFEDARDAEDSVRGLDGRTVCGRRCRVELSTGKTARRRSDDRDRGSDRSRDRGRGGRGGGDRDGGRPFHPDDRCYECGDRGHYARDCGKYGKKGGKRRSRSRSRSRSRDKVASRSRSYTRSRSPVEKRERRSRSKSEKRSPRPGVNGNSRSPRLSRTKSKSRSRSPPSPRSNSRSRSPAERRSHSSRRKLDDD